MKIVLIAYNEALDIDVMQILKNAGADGYTKWTQVLGSGPASGPHLLTNVWPKGNNVLLCSISDEAAKQIMDAVRELRKSMGHEGVKAFTVPLEDITD